MTTPQSAHDDIDTDLQGMQDEDERQKLIERVEMFGKDMHRLYDEQVSLKSEVEERWLDDLRHYNGRYDRETEANLYDDEQDAKRSKVFVNLTRAKTNSAESKWSDLVLPTDDRNWGIQPTPVPELADELDDDTPLQLEGGQTLEDESTGQPLTKADMAQAELKEAEKKATNMQTEIDDQLTEAKYGSVCREVIHDATKMGIGIIKGPMVEKRSKKAWIKDEAGNWVLDFQSSAKPTAERVDPWNFFPDMTATCWDDVEFTFERHLLTRKQVRRLLRQPGFIEEQVAKVLTMAPNAKTSKLTYLNELREINGITQIHADNRYEIVEYHGPVDKEDLMACGCDGINLEDPLEEYEGVVWSCEGVVLKVGINHMDSEELPYNVLNWEKDETSIFGFGVPYRMRNPQRVMNASWRMVLDNAGLSTGPQILINKNYIEPVDGVWEMTPRKLWYITTKDVKVQAEHIMKTFTVDSNQQELTNIFEMAHRLADEETSLPQMNMANLPGDVQQPAVLKTLGGTMMAMGSNNIMMRRAVKNFDDDITVPFISRMYDWNMQFNPNNEIKGDYNVDARGTSVLLVREMQARNLSEFASLALAIPGGAEELKPRGVLKAAAKSMQLSEDDVMRTDAETENAENQDPPPDPEMMKLELQREIAQEESARTLAQLESAERIEGMQREVQLTKIAAEHDVKIKDIQEKSGIERFKTEVGIKQFYEELAIKQKSGLEANYGLEAEPS